jgi:hypothetical protein
MEGSVTAEKILPPRSWRTVAQLAKQYEDVFTPAALRALGHRAKPHYNSRGEWVEGNGLASSICQLGGKNGKIMIDGNGFAVWLEQWTGLSEAPIQKNALPEVKPLNSNQAASPDEQFGHGGMPATDRRSQILRSV